MEFQQRLYELRKQSGLSQEGLADLLGVTRQAVQKWESGASRPDMDNLAALARYFNVTLDYLVTGQEAAPPDFGPAPTIVNNYYNTFQYEYKSSRTLFGLPLVHIRLGHRGMGVAKGIFAVGNIAVGFFTLGGLSLGLFSFGGISLGLLLSLGGLSLGGIAIGGCAVGLLALGGCAVGWLAVGGGVGLGGNDLPVGQRPRPDAGGHSPKRCPPPRHPPHLRGRSTLSAPAGVTDSAGRALLQAGRCAAFFFLPFANI